MDDPVIEALQKDIEELRANLDDMQVVVERLTRNPEIRTRVGRAFQSLTLKKAALTSRFGPIVDSPHLPAIQDVFRDRPGEWLSLSEVAKITGITRGVIRAVVFSDHHKDLFERKVHSQHRHLWRLKETPPADPGEHVPENNGTSKKRPKVTVKGTTKGKKVAGKREPAKNDGSQQKASRPAGESSLRFAVDPNTGDVQEID